MTNKNHPPRDAEFDLWFEDADRIYGTYKRIRRLRRVMAIILSMALVFFLAAALNLAAAASDVMPIGSRLIYAHRTADALQDECLRAVANTCENLKSALEAGDIVPTWSPSPEFLERVYQPEAGASITREDTHKATIHYE